VSQQGLNLLEALEREQSRLERRASIRHRCECSAVILLGESPAPVSVNAKVRNISSGGIGLVLRRQLHPGTLVTIKPQGVGGPRALVARVVFSLPHTNGWQTGCELNEPLTDAEVQAWCS